MDSIVITPDESMWMAGYAARNKPSEGKVHDLHAKALALEDENGSRLVIVTVDLIGIPRPMRDWLAEHAKESYNLEPEALLLNASHTHSGPVIRETRYSIYGNTLYGLSPEQIRQSNQYVDDLQEKLLVTEKQLVTAGQRIAELGSTDATDARLHFEIRFRGSSVDPLKYLPQ